MRDGAEIQQSTQQDRDLQPLGAQHRLRAEAGDVPKRSVRSRVERERCGLPFLDIPKQGRLAGRIDRVHRGHSRSERRRVGRPTDFSETGKLMEKCREGRFAHLSSVTDSRDERAQAANGWTRPPDSRLDLELCVRVIVIVVDDPALRPAAAHHAAQEHRAVVAAHTVIMAGDVTANPAPHMTTPGNNSGASQGGCHRATIVRAMPKSKESLEMC